MDLAMVRLLPGCPVWADGAMAVMGIGVPGGLPW